MLLEDHREGCSRIHRSDPRVKILLALLFIIFLNLVSPGRWVVFGACLVLLFLLSLISRIGPGVLLKRSLVAIPFMIAAAAVPFTIPGPQLFEVPLVGLVVTEPGLVRYLTILLRSWLAVQAVVLLTAITPFPELAWGLHALKFPSSLVAIISFMYRYIFVLGDESSRMLRARTSRSPSFPGRPSPPALWQGKVAGAMVGSLFLRALSRSERIHAAMLSRGYDGHPRSLVRHGFKLMDWLALGGASAGGLIVLFWR